MSALLSTSAKTFLVNDLDQKKLTSQLAHREGVMTNDIRINLVFKHSKKI